MHGAEPPVTSATGVSRSPIPAALAVGGGCAEREERGREQPAYGWLGHRASDRTSGKAERVGSLISDRYPPSCVPLTGGFPPTAGDFSRRYPVRVMRAAGNSTGTSGAGHSPEREEVLVAQTRSRSLSRPELRESLVGGAMALGFVVTAAIVAGRSWPAGGVSLAACAVAVVALALASMAEFEIGRGAGVPTQLVFVPVLLLLPTGLAPVLVMAAYVLERLAHRDWRTRILRLHITIGSCWFSLGPTLVLLAAGVGPPSWSHWPVYVLAFAAQIGTDLVTSATSEWLVFGQAPSTTAGHVARTGLIDAALSPAGLALAIAGRGALGCALLGRLMPLIVLLRRMAEDRETRIGQASELGEAYEGTALLLGDVSRPTTPTPARTAASVVGLSRGVADVLGVDAATRRQVSSRRCCTTSARSASPTRSSTSPAS